VLRYETADRKRERSEFERLCGNAVWKIGSMRLWQRVRYETAERKREPERENRDKTERNNMLGNSNGMLAKKIVQQ